MENQKEKVMGSIMKFSSVMAMLFKIIKIICVIGVVCCIIGIISVSVIPWNKIYELAVERNASKAALNELKNINVLQLDLTMIYGMLSTIVSYYLLKYLELFFTGIKEEKTPFYEKSTNYLNKIAITSLVMGLAVPMVTAIITGIFQLFDSSVTFEASDSSLLLAIVVFGLSFIFKYGAILQKESDTTL